MKIKHASCLGMHLVFLHYRNTVQTIQMNSCKLKITTSAAPAAELMSLASSKVQTISTPKSFTKLCRISKQSHANKYPDYPSCKAKNSATRAREFKIKFSIKFLYFCAGRQWGCMTLLSLKCLRNICHPQKLDWHSCKPVLKPHSMCAIQAPHPGHETICFQ